MKWCLWLMKMKIWRSLTLISSPCDNKYSTIFKCPFPDARWSGVCDWGWWRFDYLWHWYLLHVTINIQQYSNDFSSMQDEVVFVIDENEGLTISNIDVGSNSQKINDTRKIAWFRSFNDIRFMLRRANLQIGSMWFKKSNNTQIIILWCNMKRCLWLRMMKIWLSLTLISSPCDNKYSTIFKCPFPDARWSGVCDWGWFMLRRANLQIGSMWFKKSNNTQIIILWCNMKRCLWLKTIITWSNLAFISAPWDNKYLAILKWFSINARWSGVRDWWKWRFDYL